MKSFDNNLFLPDQNRKFLYKGVEYFLSIKWEKYPWYKYGLGRYVILLHNNIDIIIDRKFEYEHYDDKYELKEILLQKFRDDYLYLFLIKEYLKCKELKNKNISDIPYITNLDNINL